MTWSTEDHSRPPSSAIEMRLWRQAVVTAAPLLAGDVLASGAAAALSLAVQHWWLGSPTAVTPFVATFLLVTPLVFACLGLYPGSGLHPVVEMRRIALATAMILATAGSWEIFSRGSVPVLITLGMAAIFQTILTIASRAISRRLASRHAAWGERVLVLGGGATALRVYRYLLANRRLGMLPVQLVDDWSADAEPESSGAALEFGPDYLRFLVHEYTASWVLITTPLDPDADRLVGTCLDVLPHVAVIPPGMRHLPRASRQMQDWGGFTAIVFHNRLLSPWWRSLKRVLDCLLVVAAGIPILPLVIVLAILVRSCSPGPVFYAHSRLGKRGRTFRAWKIRTMRSDASEVLERYLASDPELRQEWEATHKLKNDPRVTSLGRVLRKTSLDELPQLWNVLCGEMSLVGPRPIVTAEISKYADVYPLYCRATPGITGLWQISGRNQTTYEERVELDRQYVQNWSLGMDFYILLRTIKVVLRGEGAH